MDTVRWDVLIPDEQWDNEARTDIDLEKSRDQTRDALRRCNEDPKKESRVMSYRNRLR